MSKTLSLGAILGEGVPGSFFISSSSFQVTIFKAVLSLDLRPVCLVVGSLTKGFLKEGTGLPEFPGWRITLFFTCSFILSSCLPMTCKHQLVQLFCAMALLTMVSLLLGTQKGEANTFAFLCLKVILSKGGRLDLTTSLVSSFIQLVLVMTQDFLCHSKWFSKYSKKGTLLDISFMNSFHFLSTSTFCSLVWLALQASLLTRFFSKSNYLPKVTRSGVNSFLITMSQYSGGSGWYGSSISVPDGDGIF